MSLLCVSTLPRGYKSLISIGYLERRGKNSLEYSHQFANVGVIVHTKRTMKNTHVILLAAIVFIVGGGAYYIVTQSNGIQPAMVKEKETGSTEMTMVNAQSFTVTASNFSYDVPEIRVKQGDTVAITFINSEGFHDFNLDEFNVKTQQLQAGQEETVSFMADKVGTFEYYCSVGQHRANGMVGKLIVEE